MRLLLGMNVAFASPHFTRVSQEAALKAHREALTGGPRRIVVAGRSTKASHSTWLAPAG